MIGVKEVAKIGNVLDDIKKNVAAVDIAAKRILAIDTWLKKYVYEFNKFNYDDYFEDGLYKSKAPYSHQFVVTSATMQGNIEKKPYFDYRINLDSKNKVDWYGYHNNPQQYGPVDDVIAGYDHFQFTIRFYISNRYACVFEACAYRNFYKNAHYDTPEANTQREFNKVIGETVRGINKLNMKNEDALKEFLKKYVDESLEYGDKVYKEFKIEDKKRKITSICKDL